METKNAKIIDTMLGIEDHGILTCMLTLDYGGSAQGFGGWELDNFSKEFGRRIGTAFGMEFINLLLRTLEVSSWEELIGTHVRVKASHTDVHAIGHIIKDKWFIPRKHLKFLKEE